MPGPQLQALRRAVVPAPGPVRPLALATFTSRVGRGLFYTVLPLYLTRSVDLPASRVALGLTLASLVGLLAGIPAGHLADRLGPRGVRAVVRAAEALLLCGYTLVGNFAAFLVVACLVTFFESAGLAAEGALIAGSVPTEHRVRTRAYLRSVTNAAWSLGALLAGAALLRDTRTAYVLVMLGAAACYLASALATLRVPAVPPVPRKQDGPRRVALRDRPYAALTLLNGVLGMNLGLFTVALPLFIAARTNAPVALYSLLALINTVAATVFQVRASRGTDTVAGAASAQSRSGLLLAACCILFAAADGRSAWVAGAFLIAGCAVHVAGELLQAAGSWGLSFELAPEDAVGQYQGLYGMGRDLGQILTPVVATGALVDGGGTGALLLGGVFLAAGLAVPPTARWAERSRATAASVPAAPGTALP
ncbi:MFS transporter [Streptomyces sp. NPDC002055]|uniref:MFS transporter n=1 Tax=Streptomyces sp. NPDC002055 TaxID=3154534 RepID=UPI0033292CBC